MPTLRRVEIALRFLCHTSLRRARLGLREFAATVQSSASPFQDGNQDGLRVVRNDAGVQLLSPRMHAQVFGNTSFPPLDPEAVRIAKAHLASNGLAQKESPVIEAKDFTLPRMQGENIHDHFTNLGLATSAPYLQIAQNLAQIDLPQMPYTWHQSSGWTRYNSDGSFEPVDFPPDEAIVFDVETMYKISPYAVMAVAASSKAWYSWTSPWLLGETSDMVQLIPMPGETPTVIVGHNVGYDRARLLHEYNIKRTQNRFLDTMSLHMAITGLSSHQRAPWMMHRKRKKEKLALQLAAAEKDGLPVRAAELREQKRWEDLSSMNSLADVAKLHCDIDVDKSVRDYFASEDRNEILDSYQDLMNYCSNDVLVTHKVFKAVLPAFLQACPNPVSFAGVLHMGNSFLPVDESWKQFLERAEGLYNKLTSQVEKELHDLAEEARRNMFLKDPQQPDKFLHETDPWLSQLDWTLKKARNLPSESSASAKALLQSIEAGKDGAQASLAQQTSDVSQTPEGNILQEENIANEAEQIPEWYRRFRTQNTDRITREGWDQIMPMLIKLKAHGFPMQYSSDHGWCVAVPRTEAKVAKVNFEREVKITPSRKGYRHFCLTTSPQRSLFNIKGGKLFDEGVISAEHLDLCKMAYDMEVSTVGITSGAILESDLLRGVLEIAEQVLSTSLEDRKSDPWLSQLDWSGMPNPRPTADQLLQSDDPALTDNAKLDMSVGEEEMDTTAPSEEEIANGAVIAISRLSHQGDTHNDKRTFSTSTRADAVVTDMPSIENIEQPPVAKTAASGEASESGDARTSAYSAADAIWPQWYWDMARPRRGEDGLNLSIRSKAAPLLLRLRWQGHPLFYSRQHGWVYRVHLSNLARKNEENESVSVPVEFTHDADHSFSNDYEHVYFKLPHKDGADANVGSPLSKSFIAAFDEGILSSEYPAASAALDMNAQCSYWISARERVLNQLVVWQDGSHDRGFPVKSDTQHGLILPQVVTMGTVTRRAVESTWLAASNAKKNRLGSELKAMIRAPEGYSIVGADVDSEELWICCVMGDAQFGLHGATAIGWMTLEGTKSAGTDLHSKTASILGISRDKAKVFNYSRIYGAGVKHAVQLLMQANPKLSKKDATEQAQKLYAATKGLRNYRAKNASSESFERANGKFWYGGTESHVFNVLEEVAMAGNPRTPALGCGVTSALAKDNLPATEKSAAGEDFMPSRINWVVQSSGVDYLHLLIVSMEYLCQRFDIGARFMLSVHDEIRYLVKDEDKYRAALALQISNLWTRAIFSYRLKMESLPQSCAFFSAVDIDRVLRKEVNMDCVTPSQPDPIPHGISQEIDDTLSSSGGTLFRDGRPMEAEVDLPSVNIATGFKHKTPIGIEYRATDTFFLEAQDAKSKAHLAAVLHKRNLAQQGIPYYDYDFDSTATQRRKREPKRDKASIDQTLNPALGETSRAGTPENRDKRPIVELPLRSAPRPRSMRAISE